MAETSTEDVKNNVDPAEAEKTAKKKQWSLALIAGFGMSLVGALFVMAFLWPLNSGGDPEDIDLAIAGPEQAVTGIEQNLSEQQGDVFNVTTMDTRDEAVDAIEARDASGAIVMGEDGMEILTASAGGPQISQMMTQMADGLEAQAAQQGQETQVEVTDVVSAGENASAANMIILPVLIAGMAGSMVSIFAVKKPYMRFASLGMLAIGTGLVSSAVLGPWFNVLDGNYWAQAGALAMGVLAIGGTITGLGTLLGKGGLGLGALLIILIANPWSGMLMPREFLPDPMATIGANMPNGAMLNLLRSISFFPDAATGHQWMVLIIWAAVGLAMIGVGALLHHKKQPQHQAVSA